MRKLDLNKYIKFCNYFQKFNIPELKLKEIPREYSFIYKNSYNVDEENVSKATTVVFLATFIVSSILSLLILTINNFLLAIIFSLLIGFLISYKFNTILYKEIKKEEKVLNALLYLIKINFSLIKKTLDKKSELCLSFIRLIINYKIPLSESFKSILGRIYRGATPEKELGDIETPSSDFNDYKNDLIVSNFNHDFNFDYFAENTSEKNVKILLRALESKLGIAFLLGIFFPILLCLFIFLFELNLLSTIIVIPLFLFFAHLLFKKLIRLNVLLIGFVEDFTSVERKIFNEFLLFLKGIAIHLKYNYGPEVAFKEAYAKNKNNMILIQEKLGNNISLLINLQYTLGDLIDQLKYDFNSPKYKIILSVLENMFEKNAYYTSEKISDILDIIEKHRRLEEKFRILIKGEQPKVVIFIVFLPIILGILGALLPLVMAVMVYLDNFETIETTKNYFDLVSLIDIISVFIILILCNFISTYYFLKIVHYERSKVIITISEFIFIFTFFLTLLFSINIIS